MKNYYKLQLTNSYNSYFYINLRKGNQNMYAALTCIGEEIDDEMYDLLTGERLIEVDEYTVLPYLTYYKKEKAKPYDLVNLRNLINEDKARYDYYKNALMYILECNKKEYQEFLQAEEELKELRRQKI